MAIRTYLLAFLSFGMALAIFSHFGCMLVIGEFTICEPNTAILTAETIIIALIAVFSFYCVIEQIRKVGTNRK
jgi:uncharacterized membrane protein YidH (DUF202 family)